MTNGISTSTASTNTYIYGGTMDACTYGIQATLGPCFIQGVTFNNCTYGIASRFRGYWQVIDCNFTNCQYCIYDDGYCGYLAIRNCNFGTPTSYGVSRANESHTIRIDKCSITAGQEAKFIYYTPGAGQGWTGMPYYIISNCSNSSYPDGTYYNVLTAQQNNVTYKTSSPSLRIKASIAWTYNNVIDIPVVSTYAANGVSKTISLWIKADASWVGTLVPVWRLNGGIIKEETTIASLSTTWTNYTWTVSSGLITSDGILDLSFRPNMNTVSVYIDKDITIT